MVHWDWEGQAKLKEHRVVKVFIKEVRGRKVHKKKKGKKEGKEVQSWEREAEEEKERELKIKSRGR